jgi:hypothetical protein
VELTGNYNLEIRVGENVLPITPQMIEELTISQDIDRIVPTFKMRVKDATNLLGAVVPYDRDSNEITLSFSRGRNFDKRNVFVFSVKRRRALSDRTYEVEGLLKTEGLFSPHRLRAITGNLKSSLESIASDELKLEDHKIGASLNYVKTVLQPDWDNAFLLRYLKERVEGKGGETCYYSFIKNVRGTPTLVFKSIEELFLSKITYRFIVGEKPFQDFYPVSEYRVFDNSQFRAFFSSRSAEYSYFDYSTGEYKTVTSVDLEDYPSLTEYHSVDKDDNTNMSVPHLGRSNDFTEDFSGRVGQTFYNGLTNSIYMWISTWGIENVAQGDIVQVLFAEALNRGNLFVYQHSGIWMVKRVVHIFGNSYMTNLLLARNGVDTDIETTFTPATEVRKE